MVSSSVQKPVAPSSSSSTKPPVSQEAQEKVLIKQVFGSEEESVGE